MVMGLDAFRVFIGGRSAHAWSFTWFFSFYIPFLYTLQTYKTALHLAVGCGELNVVKVLARRNLVWGDVGIDCVTSNGLSALMIACQQGRSEIVKELIHASADLHVHNMVTSHKVRTHSFALKESVCNAELH